MTLSERRLTDDDSDKQMIKYGELRKALISYTRGDLQQDVPVDYYRRVIKACFRANNSGLDWDVDQAASILLYLAFNDGYLHPSQLNPDGLKTLDRAELFLEQVRSSEHKRVVENLLSSSP